MVSKVSIPGFNSGGSVSKADVRSNIMKHNIYDYSLNAAYMVAKFLDVILHRIRSGDRKR